MALVSLKSLEIMKVVPCGPLIRPTGTATTVMNPSLDVGCWRKR